MDYLVVVILVNYNQNEYTLTCINSILKCEYSNFKILLIDNGSSNTNAKKLEKELPISDKILYKRLKNNIGYAKGTNCGLKEGLKLDPDYFLIMNNDTIIDKYALKELVNTCILYRNKVIVTGKVYHYNKPNELQIVGYEYKNKNFLTFRQLGKNQIDNGQFDTEKERDMIDDIFVLHPANIYKSIGGYSPFLWVNGVNIDMGLRAKEIGYKFIYTPKAKIWHKGSVSIGGRNLNPKIAYWNIQSSLIIRYQFLSSINFFIYYLMTVNSIVRTRIKSVFLNDDGFSKYSKAKYYGLKYFHKWQKEKNHNNGIVPHYLE